MNRIRTLWNKYYHALPLLIYVVIYWLWFWHLEGAVTDPHYIIHMHIDDYIPFCELFVIPYFMWFPYMFVVILYLLLMDKHEYFRTCIFLFTGMTIFLIISTLWPNGHNLRLTVMPRENLFTHMVEALWRTDTPNNLWPSVHVYNSLGIHLGVAHSRCLSEKKPIKMTSFLLCSAIILSTLFIKQHSMFDVLTAFIMAALMYVIVYRLMSIEFMKNLKHPKSFPSQV
ncbi:MAG: serine/threonine protein phosphatase [Lachnospiraceae bacterium]|nr:serine/threonine protein phosphatase [Lachnospiraceae bacterium]